MKYERFQITDGSLKRQTKKGPNYTRYFIYILLALVAVGQIFPLIWLVNYSLMKDGDLFGPKLLMWPREPQFSNYKVAWVDGKIPQYLLNSVIINVVSVGLTVLFSVMMSYAFVRMQWKLKKFFLTTILLGMMIPLHATLLPNFASFRALGIADSYLGLIIPYIGITLQWAPFADWFY